MWGCSSEFTEIQPATPAPADDPDYVITLAEAEADLLSILNDKNFQAPTTRNGGARRIADRFSLGSPVSSTRAEGEDTEEGVNDNDDTVRLYNNTLRLGLGYRF